MLLTLTEKTMDQHKLSLTVVVAVVLIILLGACHTMNSSLGLGRDNSLSCEVSGDQNQTNKLGAEESEDSGASKREEHSTGTLEVSGVAACPFETRKVRLDAYCRKHYPEKRSRLKDIAPMPRWVTDDVHKVFICVTPKSGSSSWRHLVKQVPAGVAPSWNFRPIWKIYSEDEIRYRLKNYQRVIVARHPMDRLASAFNDKFRVDYNYSWHLRPYILDYIRYNRTNISSADYRRKLFRNKTLGNVDEERDYILEQHLDDYSKYVNTQDESNPLRVTFTEFLQFLLRDDMRNDNWHWNSIEDSCHPCNVEYDVIVKMNTIDRDSRHVIKKMTEVADVPGILTLDNRHSFRKNTIADWNTSETVGYIQNRLVTMDKGYMPAVAGQPLVVKRLADYQDVPPDIVEGILDKYWADMVMFGFDFNVKESLMECTETHNGQPCC